MCVKSRNHLCSQVLLQLIIIISLLFFVLSIVGHIGLYFLTAPSEKSSDLIALSSGDNSDDVEILAGHNESGGISDEWILKSNCSWIQTQIDIGKLFELCHEANTDTSKVECFRTTVLYTGLGSIVPAIIVLLSLISVCRLLLCPILLLGLVYLLLAIFYILVCCLYHDSVILNALSVSGTLTPLAYQLISLAALYILLALLHFWLFSFVTCERRRAASSKGLKHSTSDDENGLDIDDPRAPLYGYSSRPGTDFDERVKDFKYIDDDMSYILRK